MNEVKCFDVMVPLKPWSLATDNHTKTVIRGVREKYVNTSIGNHYIIEILNMKVLERLIDHVTGDLHVKVKIRAKTCTLNVGDSITIKIVVVAAEGFKGEMEDCRYVSVLVPAKAMPESAKYLAPSSSTEISKGGKFKIGSQTLKCGSLVEVKLTGVRYEPQRVACQAVLFDL